MASAIWNEKEQRWTLRLKKDGKVKKFTSIKKGIAGKREVLRKAREYENNGTTDRYKAKCSYVWSLYMEDIASRQGIHTETYKKNVTVGKYHILPIIGNIRMSSLHKDDFQRLINNAKPHKDRTGVLSKDYIRAIRLSLSTFIRYGVENGYCDPFYGSLYIPIGHPSREKVILQPKDIRRLFEPSDLHYHLALCFLCVTGLRPGEMFGIKWSDVGSDVINIQRSVNYRGVITEGKTKNAKRVVPISPIVRGILDRQRENTKHLNPEWVFCSPIGGPGSQSTLAHHMIALGEERGFKGSPYSLRHTFISMVKTSIPEPIIKELVGHSVSMDTFGVYGHRVDGELKEAAKLIDLTFKEATKTE